MENTKEKIKVFEKPKKIVRSAEYCKKLSEALKGHKVTEETKKKISEANKGRIPWSKGKTGVYSEDTLKKISENTKKAMENPEIRKKISERLKGKIVGEKNPFYGKHHTEETKQLLSEQRFGIPMPEATKQKISKATKGILKNEETRRKMSEAQKGNTKNLGKIATKEKKDKLSKLHKGKIVSIETREKNSKAAIKRLLANDCKNTAWKHSKKGKFYSDKNQNELRYESSYELTAFKILEQLSKVVSYDRCPHVIKYEFNGKRRYLPDILVTYEDASKEIIEVKPKYMLKDIKTQAKKLAGENYCSANNMIYSIWSEKELGL